MPGSKTNAMKREEVLAAVRALPVSGDYVWDGQDDNERPAPPQALAEALVGGPRKRGRPAGTGTKEQVAIRFDRDVVAALRATGPGWQTRVNEVIRDWLRRRPSP